MIPRGKDEKDFENRVKECLKLPGGKRMGAGDVPQSDVERPKAGPPIGSGCGPTRIGRAAKPRFPGASRGRQCAPSRRASAPARSRRRPAAPPFGPF
ncbi:hypothetical protein BVRB_2g041350 [Beta vulgaris subsp. vulgaris]|nr:hypothetical protein BVRB_2g041350 [Beta vulgaris subsp. vulgaris]